MVEAPATRIRAPGRTCPPSYGYSPHVFARAADFDAEVLYVIGGLYGNALALDVIEALATSESVAPTLIFNGDFHWFDAEPAAFAQIQRRVFARRALRGNVETEIASDDDAAGCGCAYPEAVPDDDVERSNAILERLRRTAGQVEGSRAALGVLPMHAVAQVGTARVAIVHGDAWALAGWRFAHDRLHAEPDDSLETAFELAAVDGFASSHTCAPALKATARGFVINNGAAGMANFAGTTHGVITRIATRALPRALEPLRLYGLHDWVRGGPCIVDALKVDFDAGAWLACFDALWPAGTPAAVSYRRRIAEGPDFAIDHALGRALAVCAT